MTLRVAAALRVTAALKAAAVLATASALVTGCSSGSQTSTSNTTSTTTPKVTTSTTPVGTPLSINTLVVGQCFNQAPDPAQRGTVVLAVPCADSHEFEIFARFTYLDGNKRAVPNGFPYTDETTVRKASEQRCYEQFEAWMGSAWTASDYDIQTYWPSGNSWDRGDRIIVCSVYRFDRKRTNGSAQGTKS